MIATAADNGRQREMEAKWKLNRSGAPSVPAPEAVRCPPEAVRSPPRGGMLPLAVFIPRHPQEWPVRTALV